MTFAYSLPISSGIGAQLVRTTSTTTSVVDDAFPAFLALSAVEQHAITTFQTDAVDNLYHLLTRDGMSPSTIETLKTNWQIWCANIDQLYPPVVHGRRLTQIDDNLLTWYFLQGVFILTMQIANQINYASYTNVAISIHQEDGNLVLLLAYNGLRSFTRSQEEDSRILATTENYILRTLDQREGSTTSNTFVRLVTLNSDVQGHSEQRILAYLNALRLSGVTVVPYAISSTNQICANCTSALHTSGHYNDFEPLSYQGEGMDYPEELRSFRGLMGLFHRILINRANCVGLSHDASSASASGSGSNGGSGEEL